MSPSNCSRAAAASTETTVFGSSVTSSRYNEPNTMFSAIINERTFNMSRTKNDGHNQTKTKNNRILLTIERNFWIDNFDGNEILFALTPRSAEHAGKIWALAQIDLMQMPHFTQHHHRYIRILLFHKERFVNVLRRCHQFFPVKKTTTTKKTQNNNKHSISNSLDALFCGCGFLLLSFAHLLHRSVEVFSYAWIDFIAGFWIDFLMLSLSAANYLRHAARIRTKWPIYSTINAAHYCDRFGVCVCVLVCSFVLFTYNSILHLIYLLLPGANVCASEINDDDDMRWDISFTIRYQRAKTRSRRRWWRWEKLESLDIWK